MERKDRIVRDLRRKLRLLWEHHHYANLDAIAADLEIKKKTLESWADSGSDLQTPGLVTKVGFKKLVSVFERAICKNHDYVDIEVALRGETARLADLLKPNHTINLRELIDREAIKNQASVFTQDGRLSLVKKQVQHPDEPDFKIRQGQLFRIVFSGAGEGRHLIALQQSGQDWGYVGTHLETSSAEICLPDLDERGMPALMSETDEIDTSRFIALQASSPVPTEIIRSTEIEIRPDQQKLESILNWYLEHPVQQRRLFETRIDFQTA